jgi:hypothetical protein
MWSGSSGSSEDEWIELYNRSAATIDLSGWTLTRLSNGEFQVMFIFDTTSIASGQTLLIANYTADHEKSPLATEPGFVSTSISLPNSELLLQLHGNNSANGGQLIDSVDDGQGAPFAGSTTPKQAMVRIAFDQPGHLSTSRATATMQSELGPQCD